MSEFIEETRNIEEVKEEKHTKMMRTIAWRAGYYRANPQRFVKEALQFTDIRLRWFQELLLWAMMHNNFFLFCGSRGIGKTFLVALFLVCRAILYPGSKIIITASVLKQANESLAKIRDELCPQSAFLRNEIEKINISQNDGSIFFKNGSWIKTTTSTDNARSQRANIIIVDEYVKTDKRIIDTVIKEFLKAPRSPGYLKYPQYAHLQERNKEIYMSSPWLKSSWGYDKFLAYFKNFLNPKRKYFVCGLPYQISVFEGLLMRDEIEDRMSEDDFDETAFHMEDECFWYGDNEGGVFSFDDASRLRVNKKGLLPLKFYSKDNPVPPPPKNGERILSVDIALMASTKKKRNDASAIYINDAIRTTDTKYKAHFVFGQTFEGLTADELSLIIMRYFYQYHCTYLVIDGAGVGLGVADGLIKDQYDPEMGETYKALNYCNNNEMAQRCKVRDAKKVMYCVKASADSNSTYCLLLRNAIQNGNVDFLVSENDAEIYLSKEFKGYKKLTVYEKSELLKSYAETSAAIFELVKLKGYYKDGKLKVYETKGNRKDRYSSLSYNYWCMKQLELQLKPNISDVEQLVYSLPIRRGRTRNNRVI